MRDFIPGTCEREIAPGIVFRPVRSWHSANYAGEKRANVDGDGSGCAITRPGDPRLFCSIPLTVTHRIYWNKLTDKSISAFLSYPGGMGYFGNGLGNEDYFWEILPCADDIARFASEAEMEAEVVKILQTQETPR